MTVSILDILVSKTGIKDRYLASRLFGPSSLFSVYHTFIDMRKNVVLIKEEKGEGKTDWSY